MALFERSESAWSSTIAFLLCFTFMLTTGFQPAHAAHEQDIDDVVNWVFCQAGDRSDCGSFPGGQSLAARYSAEQVQAALRDGVLETRDHVRNAYRSYFREYCAVPASRRTKESEARLAAAEAEVATAEAELKEVEARLEARRAAEETAKLAATAKSEVETADERLARAKTSLTLAKQQAQTSQGNTEALQTAISEVTQARTELAIMAISDAEIMQAITNADDLITKARAEIRKEETAVKDETDIAVYYTMKIPDAQLAVNDATNYANMFPDVSDMFNQATLRLYAIDRWREAAYILSSDIRGSGRTELQDIANRLAKLRQEVDNQNNAPYFYGTNTQSSESRLLALIELVNALSPFKYNFNDFDINEYDYSELNFPRLYFLFNIVLFIEETNSSLDPRPTLITTLRDIVGMFEPGGDLGLADITESKSREARIDYDQYLSQLNKFKEARANLHAAEQNLAEYQGKLAAAQERLTATQERLTAAQERLTAAELAKTAAEKLGESKNAVEAATERLITAAQKLAEVGGTDAIRAALTSAEREIEAAEASLAEATMILVDIRGPSGLGPNLTVAQAKLAEADTKLAEVRETERISEQDCLAHPPPTRPDPRTLEKVAERESALSTARAASSFLSRTVVNRIQNLRSPGESSFEKPKNTSSNITGINAGDVALPDYRLNMAAVELSHSKSQISGQFETRSSHALAMMETLLTPQRLAGIGVGTEYTRESLLGGSVKRSKGLTATAYLAEILNKNFILVPQAALTLLDKEKQLPSGAKDDEKTMRTLFSLTILGQKQWGSLELSGFGQLAYTREDSTTTDNDAIYLGQATAGGECALAVRANTHLFVGASMGYDLARSESTSDRFSYDGKLGLRSQLGSRTELSLSISTGGRDDERTTSGNVFVKIFF